MLELVATMPSKPFGAGVLVTLDIVSRSTRLGYCCGPCGGGAGTATFFYTPKRAYIPDGPGNFGVGLAMSALQRKIFCLPGSCRRRWLRLPGATKPSVLDWTAECGCPHMSISAN